MSEKTKQAARKGLDTQDAEIPRLLVMGDFLDKVSLVQGISMSLVVSLGEVEQTSGRVLVPFVVMKSQGYSSVSETHQVDTLHEMTIPLENAAFLISNAAAGLETAVQELTEMSTGIRPEIARLRTMSQLTAKAKESLVSCSEKLDRLLSSIS